MQPKLLLLAVALIFYTFCFAGTLSGKITDDDDQPLPFSSVLVKGTLKGTTANNAGKYVLQLAKGEYTIVVQHVGYKSVERKIVVDKDEVTADFKLSIQTYDMGNVVVKKGEDPAYEIIRQAIKKRKYYETEIKKYETEVYMKGQLKLRNYPKKFMGSEVDFEDGDTSKKKMLFLSETVAKYSVDEPKRKIEVLSSRVSGEKNGFGFANPYIFSFYQNNIMLGNLNPRGFISPIADGAMGFYRYKFEGTYFENNKMVNRIKVIPKRKYEPLFNGYINIIEDEWRIQSVDLVLYKENQMQLVDTLIIQQLYVPYKNKWVIKQQTIYPAIKIFGFDATGNFLQVYDKFNLDPQFKKGFFDNVVLKYTDSSNKKAKNYWDTVRPVPLLDEEVKDYKKKDSLEVVRQSPHYLDSLDRRNNKPNLIGLFMNGQTFTKRKHKSSLSIDGLLNTINFNTMEGTVIDYSPTYRKTFNEQHRSTLSITPNLRYGFSNEHFNADLATTYTFGKKGYSYVSVAGGTRVFQFDNSNPISERLNTVSTLQYERSYIKLYEAAYGRVSFGKEVGNGVIVSASVRYQDRKPLENTTTTKWKDYADRVFSPNFPLTPHQAFIGILSLRWQPGTRYVEFPEQTVSIGSKAPTFTLVYTQGFKGIAGSDVDYNKWRFQMRDRLNMRLAGMLEYRLAAGGFLNTNSVFFPDYQHFSGNQLTVASDYLNSFQLMPYYSYSNIEKFYSTAHVEYHLNGLLTNKIPGFKKLNWFIVTGTNLLHLKSGNNYGEVFAGLENILKIFRVDYVRSLNDNIGNRNGIRISLPGFLTGEGDISIRQ